MPLARRHHLATEVGQHVPGNFENERIVIDNQYGTRHFELPADSVPAAIQRDRTLSVPLVSGPEFCLASWTGTNRIWKRRLD